jgi:hypothetical protein
MIHSDWPICNGLVFYPRVLYTPKISDRCVSFLRRRLLFVKHRTAHLLSLRSMIERHPVQRVSVNQLVQWFESDRELLIVRCQLDLIDYLKKLIDAIEKHIVSAVKLRKQFHMLLTITGIGKNFSFNDHAGSCRDQPLLQSGSLQLLLLLCQKSTLFKW